MLFRFIENTNAHLITRATDCSFLFLIQRATLLALKEANHLTEMQYRQAEEVLLQQCKKNLKTTTTS